MKLSIRFYLNQPKTIETSIISSISFDAIRVRTSTGISIPTKYWSKTTQQLKSTYPNSLLTNALIDRYRSRIKEDVLECILSNVPITPEKLKEIAVKNSLSNNNRNTEKPILLLDWSNIFLKEMEKGNIKKSTLSFYKSVFKDFQIFEKHIGMKLKVSDVNKNLLQKYCIDYLMEFKGSTNNTAITYYAVIKIFLKYLEFDKGLTIDNSYKHIKIKRHQSRELTITINEFKTLLNLDITDIDLYYQKQLKVVRDRFVLSVLTGIRNSDMNQIRSSMTPIIDSDGEQFYLFKSEKTRSEIRIPIVGIIKEILIRNDYDMKEFSSTLSIYYLKRLFKMAKIDRLFTKEVTSNNQTVKTTKPAYDLVGTHTGRRSTVTILRGLGIPNTKIMQVTTHKDESMILRYDNTEQKEAVNDVYNAFAKAFS